MSYALTLVGSFSLFILLVYLRYLYIRWGLKDRNYAAVQRLERQEISRETADSFLSGSRSVINEPEDKERYTRDKPKPHRPFGTLADIRRSYMIDAILDKPKWR
ncbi:MAG: hypothetical protein NWR72_15355, partial [Bacteroidia bacterium]|nr:hypothetical protein [Bacteroidia bacterium]